MDGSLYPCTWSEDHFALPMIVDSFAGGGGASTGIEQALGRSPDVAINHSDKALALHQANHPDTLHLDSNIWDIDPLEVSGGRHVGLLWASPDCKHFSKAKGKALRDRNMRDLAWVVVRWAEVVKPDVIILENVEEFPTWGPVDDEGRVIEWLRGHTFEEWVRRLRAAGYKVEWKELRACDYGAPTIRKRWFCVARRDGRKVVWPKPTHGAPESPEVRRGKRLPYRTAAECIDWSLPAPSIFASSTDIKEQLGIRAVRPLAPNTLARIARGMKRYVLEAEKPFLVSVAHGDSGGRREYPLDEPHGTVTAGGISHAVISPSVIRFNGGATGQDARDPLSTITANSFVKRPGGAAPLGVVAPMLTHLYTSNTAGGQGDPLRPIKTITAGGLHSALVSPVLTYAQHGGRCRDARDPHHTITASNKDQNALIAPTLVQTGYGERKGQEPRCLDMHQPLGTIVAGGAKHAPVAAFLAQQNNDSRRVGGVNPGRPVNAPISTITASGSHQTPVAAYVARHFGASVGHSAAAPHGTITAGGAGKSSPVAAWFAKYYGTGDGAAVDEPCHTVTVRDRFGHCQAELGAPPFSPEHEARARQVAAFLRAHDAWDGGEFVTLEIDGATFVVIDIGMRMLTPRELYKAQGFPSDYVIDGIWQETEDDWAFKPFTKDVQVSCVGNSVCPDLARALVEANCGHLAAAQEVA